MTAKLMLAVCFELSWGLWLEVSFSLCEPLHETSWSFQHYRWIPVVSLLWEPGRICKSSFDLVLASPEHHFCQILLVNWVIKQRGIRSRLLMGVKAKNCLPFQLNTHIKHVQDPILSLVLDMVVNLEFVFLFFIFIFPFSSLSSSAMCLGISSMSVSSEPSFCFFSKFCLI